LHPQQTASAAAARKIQSNRNLSISCLLDLTKVTFGEVSHGTILHTAKDNVKIKRTPSCRCRQSRRRLCRSQSSIDSEDFSGMPHQPADAFMSGDFTAIGHTHLYRGGAWASSLLVAGF